MTAPMDMTMDELQTALVDRIRKRSYGSGPDTTEVCYLDLRGKSWGGIGTLVLRDPRAVGWPDAGETTHHLATARGWVSGESNRYADWVARRLRGEDTELTVDAAVEPYILAMHKDPHLGPDHSTVSQRRSHLRRQIGPKLHGQRLLTLPRAKVQEWLDALQVTKSRHGIAYQEPASVATRKAVYASLIALYRHHYPGQSVPFGGVRIGRAKAEAARRRELVRQGRGRELIQKRTYTPDEILRLLLTARYIDLHPEAGVVASWVCRTLAPFTAAQLAIGSRIAELCQMVWADIEDDEFVFIGGTKSASAIRYMPLQHSVLPWLRLLREAQALPHLPEHHILRLHPEQDAPPAKDVWARKMAKVQTIAGLKIEGERSHIYRRTHASMALMRGIPPHDLKLLLGHAEIAGGATDDYIQMIRQLTRPEHREYIRLPSPQEIDAILDEGWEPPHLPASRTPTGRPRHGSR